MPGTVLSSLLQRKDINPDELYRFPGNTRRKNPHGVTADNGFKLFNSGVCAVTDRDSALFDTSIRFIDEWTRDGFDIHTIEQIALSFALHGKPVEETRKSIYHYFADKRFFHAMQALFFYRHGEAFSHQLVELCRDVPQEKPFPSAWQRLKIKWKLRHQRGPLRKVGRDLLYGSAAPNHPYYTACRHEWWESASREILRWDRSRQKKLLETRQGWPAQLPRPERPEDERIIMKYLKNRVGAAS